MMTGLLSVSMQRQSYFFMPSFDMLPFDIEPCFFIPSLDITSSFFVPSLDMLSLAIPSLPILSCAKAAGEERPTATTRADIESKA
jgi:hypothetical protein